ncbi:MAG TPA: FAH family protein, partial [Rhizobacter sp.]
MRLIQFIDDDGAPSVGRVSDDGVRRIAGFRSTYALAEAALARGVGLEAVAEASGMSGAALPYALLQQERRVLPPVTHPDPARCLVSGTGLTHLGSAATRDAMHHKLAGGEETLSDSMRMFKWGLDGGKP